MNIERGWHENMDFLLSLKLPWCLMLPATENKQAQTTSHGASIHQYLFSPKISWKTLLQFRCKNVKILLLAVYSILG